MSVKGWKACWGKFILCTDEGKSPIQVASSIATSFHEWMISSQLLFCSYHDVEIQSAYAQNPTCTWANIFIKYLKKDKKLEPTAIESPNGLQSQKTSTGISRMSFNFRPKARVAKSGNPFPVSKMTGYRSKKPSSLSWYDSNKLFLYCQTTYVKRWKIPSFSTITIPRASLSLDTCSFHLCFFSL